MLMLRGSPSFSRRVRFSSSFAMIASDAIAIFGSRTNGWLESVFCETTGALPCWASSAGSDLVATAASTAAEIRPVTTRRAEVDIIIGKPPNLNEESILQRKPSYDGAHE